MGVSRAHPNRRLGRNPPQVAICSRRRASDWSVRYVPAAPPGAVHQRPVRWVRADLPRSEVDQDLLYSLGSTLTVFGVRRNNAEERLSALVQTGRADAVVPPTDGEGPEQDDGEPDLEQFAADQIVNFISRKFRGHELARLVAAILAAEGYQIQVARPGADGGVDIIAGTGTYGVRSPTYRNSGQIWRYAR